MARVGQTWPMGVIPDEREMQKAVPSMSMLPALLPFSMPRTPQMSSRKGMKATKRTEGEMKSPRTVTAAKRKAVKAQGPRLAMGLVMKATVTLRTKLVRDRG